MTWLSEMEQAYKMLHLLFQKNRGSHPEDLIGIRPTPAPRVVGDCINRMNAQKEIETPGHDHVNTKDTTPCILVVEDDRSIAEMLESAFKAWGYEVKLARNGQEGLDIVATQSVDGILLDMHMPIMDGRTMLDELRWEGHELPVLVMSGGSDLRDLRQLLHEGAQGFFIKPFQLQSLKQSCAQIFLSDGSSEKSPRIRRFSNKESDA